MPMRKVKGQSGAEVIIPSVGDLIWEDGKVAFIFTEFGFHRWYDGDSAWGFMYLHFKTHERFIYSLSHNRGPKLTAKNNYAKKNGERIYYYPHLLPHPTNEGHWVIEMREGKSDLYKELVMLPKYRKLHSA
jgi:hypothetical protein